MTVDPTHIAILGVFIVIIVYLLCSSSSSSSPPLNTIVFREPFNGNNTTQNNANVINHPRYRLRDSEFLSGSSPANTRRWRESTFGVQDKLVDTMACHPDCCGDQWPVPFDGLTAGEIEQRLQEQNLSNDGPYIRTNMTCANGVNGVGCPCIKKDPYLFLVNRGNNTSSVQNVEPTFQSHTLGPYLRNNSRAFAATMYGDFRDNLSPYDQIDDIRSRKSIRVDSPLLNDIIAQRRPVIPFNPQPNSDTVNGNASS